MPKKLILDIDEDIWKEVRKFKVDEDLNSLNDATVYLIKEGLKVVKERVKPTTT